MAEGTCSECGGLRHKPCDECEGYGNVPFRCRCGDLHGHECPRCNGFKRYHCPLCAPALMRGRYFGEYVTELP